MIPGSANPLLLKPAEAAAAEGISRSLRFNSSDSGFLSRTPASAGNRKTWTWAGWVKRSALASSYTNTHLFGTGATSGSPVQLAIYFQADTLQVEQYQGSGTNYFYIRTSAVFRDLSAWYHVVVAWDTTQGTDSNRIKIYVNGVLQTQLLVTQYPTQNFDGQINAAVEHRIGAWANGFYFSGYLADVHFIDGQALDPSSFGEFDTNGVWQPIAYTGSYGTNGFHLPFSDNSTAAALGTDTSGNSNTWTVNNISVTAGAGNDSLVDSPTNGTQTDTGAGGEVVGNYATLNPLDRSSSLPTLSNGNLDIKTSTRTAQNESCRGTVGVSAGKWYFECAVTPVYAASFQAGEVGIKAVGTSLANRASDASDAFCFGVGGNGSTWYKRNNSSLTNLTTSGATTGTVLSVAFDLDAGKVWVAKDGVWENSGNPASGTNAQFTSIASGTYAVVVTPYSNDASNYTDFSLNAGQRPFAYTAPSGFKALCTTNLPEPTIADGSTAMDVALYTGNGSTQTISGLNFSPDFIWFKARSSALSHQIFDQIRGVTKVLFSDSTAGEGTETDRLTAFNSDGFTLGTDAAGRVNGSGTTYVAWTWDAGSSTVSNTDGSITSSVRANASAGFSIVSYTGTGSLATIGHGLNAAPELILVKSRTNAENWAVYSKAAGAANRLILNLTVSAASGNEYWNSTDPTSSVFTVNTVGQANGSGQNYVAYCFAPVDGYSSFGSYTGNGSTDGTFVYTGFRPRWIMIKNSSASSDSWVMHDTARNTYNVVDALLMPNQSTQETTSTNYHHDILSNGFKLRTALSAYNSSGATYIYAAFAEHPFATSRAR